MYKFKILLFIQVKSTTLVLVKSIWVPNVVETLLINKYDKLINSICLELVEFKIQQKN